MATFLFWNMGKKALTEPLFRLVVRHEVDVLMLAECALESGKVLEALNLNRVQYHFPNTVAAKRGRVRIFTRFEGKFLKHVENHSNFHWTARQLFLPGAPSVLIVGVHLLSKLNTNPSEQASFCGELARAIQKIEGAIGHQRTIVIGDFNVNPFELGMLSALALHAEPTRKVAEAKSRIVQKQERPFFYNPMWNFFGDATRGPAGTYHYSGSGAERVVWNMFDQVLLRPELLPFFQVKELEILTGDGQDSFLDAQSGVPGANDGSDHLPIVFKLNF